MFSGYIQGGDLIPWEPEGDGYYRTGDIFCKEESRLTFVGRCKNLIVNASGENIYIEELEQSFEALAGFGLLYGIIECNSEPVLVVQLRGGENREQLLRCINRNRGDTAGLSAPSEGCPDEIRASGYGKGRNQKAADYG